MHILCDTCSVLMLLRIAPNMFTDARYECTTVQQVWEEITQTQKFKTKYPWRKEYARHIRSLPQSKVDTEDYRLTLSAAKLTEQTQRNSRTGKTFGLSRRDIEIAACAIAHDYGVSTTDVNLVDFLKQQYDIGNVPPLKLVNDWIEKRLLEWTEFRQSVLTDWIACGEASQAHSEIKRFEKLTGSRYPSA